MKIENNNYLESIAYLMEVSGQDIEDLPIKDFVSPRECTNWSSTCIEKNMGVCPRLSIDMLCFWALSFTDRDWREIRGT